MPSAGNALRFAIGFCAWFLGAFMGFNLLRLGWTLDQNGLSVMTGRLPYWDFTNLWGGGRMALQGHVDYLFDVELYRPALRTLLSPLMLDQEWSYPPSMLLLGAPLAMLPILPAYIVWTIATLAGLFFTARHIGLSLPARLLLLTSPPVMVSLLLGQNGALTASLLVMGLFLAPVRPVLAGLCFGLLSVKPHLGLLVPFCLLASGNFRAIIWSAVSCVMVVVLTGLLFGWQTWSFFFSETNPMMRAIMEASYPQGYHANAMTVFILSRSLGAGVNLSYAVQIASALGAIAAVIWLWRRPVAVGHDVRVAITGLLALCATPYGYTYDAVPMALAVLVLARNRLVPAPLLAAGWLYPIVNHMIVLHAPAIGILVPALIALTAMASLARMSHLHGGESIAQPATACAAPPSR